jgi:hypothetical protein
VTNRRLAGGVLIVIVVATFARGLNPWLESDDFSLLALVRSEGAGGLGRWFALELGRTWSYRPVVLAAAGTLSAAFGTNGLPYHVLSLALHLAAGLVLLALGGAGTRAPALALVGPLFFLVHPRAEESVYWFSAVAYPLAALGGLGALTLLARASEAPPLPRRLALAGVSCAAFVLSLLSHPAALAFTPAFFLVARGPATDPRRGERLALGLPHLLAAAGSMGLTLKLESPNAFSHVAPSLGDVLRATLQLLGSTVLPLPLGPASDSVRQAIGLLTALVLLGVAVVSRDRWSWAGLSVALVAGLLTASAYPYVLEDRYHYLPALGLAIWLSSLGHGGGPPPAWLRGMRLFAWGLGVAVAGVGIVGNVRGASAWNEAGHLASAVSRSLVEIARTSAVPRLVLFGVPDNVRGAYVFRTGLPERLALDLPGVQAEVAPLGKAFLDEHRLAGRTAYLWLGETEGWLDASLERRGPELRILSPEPATGGGLTGARGDLTLVSGPYCVDLFAAAPGRAVEPRLQIRLGHLTVADLLLVEELQRYAVPVVIEEPTNTLELSLTPPEVGLGVVVPAVVVRRLAARGPGCGSSST